MEWSIVKVAQLSSKFKSSVVGLMSALQSRALSFPIHLSSRMVMICYKIAKNTGHGGFLLENNGVLFSHSFDSNNNIATGYGFGEGNVIEVITNDNELAFRNKTKGW